MSQPTKIGLNLSKKPGAAKPGATAKRPAIFGGGGDDDGDSDDGDGGGVFGRKKSGSNKGNTKPDGGPVAVAITELGDDFLSGTAPQDTDDGDDAKKKLAHRKGQPPPSQPPPSKYKKATVDGDGDTTSSPFGSDLASALTARKHREAAEALDPSIYDYDATYDAFKAGTSKNKAGGHADDGETPRKPQYMSNIRKMAEVRERDRRVAEDKKMQRERAAEGDAFDDKETFVTEAYKQQQEESKRLEEAERKREEAEAAKAAETGGMTGFYKKLLQRDEERQAAIQESLRAATAARKSRDSGGASEVGDEDEAEEDDSSTARARAINAHGGHVAVNDEGEVVDKRQLLQGGLNISARKRSDMERQKERDARNRERDRERDRNRDGDTYGSRNGDGVFAGSKQAMRDRQSRMLAAQYEQALKRSRDAEDEQTKAAQDAAKSRKTTADISSAKERYLARKRAEAEAKNAGGEP
ncbi:coiled-coil domain-containing protein [Sporothrix schenckii 1099-18]|uniref:Coiled-coil domain-containing protein n=1 Tax=Sporothrix schenckii 1099-18 TaxID=1397361 RepID=A0A0F2M9T8_SPOSC|nr:coiled-coil domain-containing protein [Sporothrix schenckii 1099-18]KJR86443.1 coiled-coil domain-containing protein [Sporothrix schenckii 1099-18]